MTTGATPPPLNTAARRHLCRLTVDPPFRCAPALSSFPGTFPMPPLEISSYTLLPSSHRRAVEEHATAPSRACGSGPRMTFVPLGWAVGSWPSRLFGRPRVAGSHALWTVASGRFRPSTVPGNLIVFPIVLNCRNRFKLQKFIETCMNVKKLQNKFCMNPLEPLFTEGLTRLTFAW
jgi:hypothetical protein